MADELVDNSPLWQRLMAFRIGDDEAQLTFEHRLARENGWTPVFAERAVLEYKRFLYLLATAGRTGKAHDRGVPCTLTNGAGAAGALLTTARDLEHWNAAVQKGQLPAFVPWLA